MSYPLQPPSTLRAGNPAASFPAPCYRAFLMAGLLLTALTTLTSCNVLGAVAYDLRDVKNAAYRPEKDDRAVVIVDDPNGLVPNVAYRQTIAANVSHHMLEHRAIESFVPNAEVLAFEQALGEEYQRKAIDAIGRELDATQVIYIRVLSLSMSSEPGITRPIISSEVRVIDATTGARRWPDTDPTGPGGSRPGFDVVTQMAFRPEREESRAGVHQIHQDLVERHGRDIARLFYRSYSGSDEP